MCAFITVYLLADINSTHCFTLFNDSDGSVASTFGSKSFNRKTQLKTKLVMDALTFGLNVLIVDLDIVFLHNPVPLVSQCIQCDIHIQDDIVAG